MQLQVAGPAAWSFAQKVQIGDNNEKEPANVSASDATVRQVGWGFEDIF